MKYQPPFDPDFAGPVAGIHNADADAGYVNGNPATGAEGSIPPAEAWEHPLRELVHLIDYSGQTPDHTDLEQVRKAIKTMIEAGVVSVGGGTPVYEGLDDDGKHRIRSLLAGDNITFTLIEDPPASGQFAIRIAAAAAGGGGGAVPLENVGDGAGTVYKGFDGTNDELRSVKGINGIVTRNTGDVIEVDGAGLESKTEAKKWFSISDGSRNLAENTAQTITSYSAPTLENQLGDSTYLNGVVTIGAEDAGMWLVTVFGNVTSGETCTSLRLSVQKNGGSYQSQRDHSGGTATIKALSVTAMVRLAAGDTVAVEALQTNGDGTARTITNVKLQMLRIGA